jgi:MoxR-like ATPase
MTYVDQKTEIEILETHNDIKEQAEHCTPVCSRNDIIDARKAVESVHLSDNLRRALVEIVHATRVSSYIQFGASTRAALMLQSALRSWALLSGRDHATEDDLKFIAPYVLMHRIKFHGTQRDNASTLRTIIEPALESLIQRGVR